MDDSVTGEPGEWATSLWQSECKDCRAERDAARRHRDANNTAGAAKQFEYSSRWANRKLDRGESRSDRCERCRRAHTEAIQALAVPYVDLRVIGEVPDPARPTGPLGGLGPLPVVHRERNFAVGSARFGFGMGDAEIIRLLDGLTQKRVAVVVAGTGTGKSTFMPFRLMTPPPHAPLRLTDFGPIVVTEPRRAAAIGVARYVGEELCLGHDSRSCNRHVGPGFPVGYQVSGEKCWDGACDLIYATDGSVINWIRDGQLARIGTVIVDEAHERSENIDIVLTQLREQLRQHEHLRVIITSATLDEAFFVSFFGEENVFRLSVPAKKSFGYGVPLFIGAKIDAKTIRDGMSIPTAPSPIAFPGWALEGPVGPDGNPEDLRETTQNLEKLRCVDEIPISEWARGDRMAQAVVSQVVKIAKETDHGDILAFLPTNRVIGWTVNQIEDRLAGLPFDVYPLLSTTSKSITEKALAARTPDQRRKIVVSSNLAETSLTVKGVRYVVDSGLICEEEWDPKIASGSFPTKPHSQSGLRQRWGRVGRDAPGWVFPLYTAEQFCSLPRNTPPESTRTNLEQFYMKLVAAGADLADAVVPGNFVASDDALDEDGRNHLAVFESESQRVRRVLQLTGALDADGDLTSFGRELERYPGDGADALALMLADQLACVHEVALALTVLGTGQLVGSRDECVLQWRKDWPAAWRVRAAQCHRGLALGCLDDLDVLLRVFSLWQRTAPDERSTWCRLWWVNEPALKAGWESVMSTVDMLSAAMKSDAERPIEPSLAIRARAVLSHCMVSARYRRAAGDVYRAELGDEAENALLGFGRLVEPLDRILAFHRFRPEGVGDEDREPYISHTVAMLDWAEYAGNDPDALSFELIRKIVSQSERSAQAQSLTPADRARSIASLLTAFPVGLVVERTTEVETGASTRVGVAGNPFLRPESRYGERATEDEDASGFDSEWSPYTRSFDDVPEEETARKVIKVVDAESNDAKAGAMPSMESQQAPGFDPTIYERVVLIEHLSTAHRKGTPEDAAPSSGARRRGIVVGYDELADDRWGLVIDPIADHLSNSDPLDQPSLTVGQEIKCIVAGPVPNHETGAIQFNRADGLGRLYVDMRSNGGVDSYDRTFLARLKPGAAVVAHVVPDGSLGRSLTLLPAARANLENAPTTKRFLNNRPIDMYPATIVEPANRWGTVIAQLDHADHTTGLMHRFDLRQRQLEQAGIADVEVGTRVLLTLQPDRTDRRRKLNLTSDEAVEFARRERRYLDFDQGTAKAKVECLPVSLALGLVEAGVNPMDVWAFVLDSYRLRVDTVLPDLPSATIPVPVRIASLFTLRRRDYAQRWDVELIVRRNECYVDVVAADEAKVAAAAATIRTLAEAPRLSVTAPNGAGTRALRDALETRSDIHFILVENDSNVVTIGGRSKTAVDRAMRELLRPASGYLVVPADKKGRLIGTGGATIRQLRDETGCADSPIGDGHWLIRGPSAASVEDFIGRAAAIVPGAYGSVTDTGRLHSITDPSAPHDTDAGATTNSTSPHAKVRQARKPASAAGPQASARRTAGAKTDVPPSTLSAPAQEEANTKQAARPTRTAQTPPNPSALPDKKESGRSKAAIPPDSQKPEERNGIWKTISSIWRK